MTGDVLSDRWETDAADTDEQPAVVLSETYHLPGDPGTPGERSETYHLPEPDALVHQDILLDQSALKSHPDPADPLDLNTGADHGLDRPAGTAYDAVAGYDSGTPGYEPGTAYEPGTGYEAGTGFESGTGYEAGTAGYEAGTTGPGYDAGAAGAGYDAVAGPDGDRDENEPGYLPLDKSYERPFGGDDDEPRRGFLGSGWSGSDEQDQGQGEVRRRTKMLIVAAAAIVVIGVGAGWMLTGSGSEPCSGAQCSSAGQVSTPVAPPAEETEDPADQPIEATPEPDMSESVTPTPTVSRARATRTPAPRATPTRDADPTPKATSKGTRAPDPKDPVTDNANDPEQPRATEAPSAKQTTQPAQAPTTAAPVPAPTESKKPGGLLDWLFG
ncbi:hypothetical protein [Nonomuraea sp. NPDC050540]|uniref:hypothetical protein n=1 Tax=Nonomuraea sp. NPDC050540 TaxID=3364367 RepID=UPI00379D7EBE